MIKRLKNILGNILGIAAVVALFGWSGFVLLKAASITLEYGTTEATITQTKDHYRSRTSYWYIYRVNGADYPDKKTSMFFLPRKFPVRYSLKRPGWHYISITKVMAADAACYGVLFLVSGLVVFNGIFKGISIIASWFLARFWLVCYLRGVLSFHLARHMDTIYSLGKALRMKPQHALSWHYMGLSLRQLKRDEESKDCLARAAKLDPRFYQDL